MRLTAMMCSAKQLPIATQASQYNQLALRQGHFCFPLLYFILEC